MQTILGPFHPQLENALADEILRHKNADPLAPLLVLLPADALRRRLKWFLVRERGLSLVNLQLLTFYQLSLKLHAEAGGAAEPVLRDDLFFEELLRQLIRARQPGGAAFAGIEERAGGCAALWQTLRDLRDGMIDPQVALEAIREGQFSTRTSERTADLLALLQTLLRFCRDKAIDGQFNFDQAAAAQAPESAFLKQFAQVFYYGFYDLTQVQLDGFHAVASHHPTLLFFPLVETRPSHEGWSFAERFYQRHVQGRNTAPPVDLLAGESESLPALLRPFDESSGRCYRKLPANWRCAITNTFGVHDEVSAAAKEILRLVDEQGIAFHEIGVVARSLEAYGAAIKEIFRLHQIPIATAVEESLVEFPLTKAVILLLNLPAKDFLRADVIDLISSPYFKAYATAEPDSPARPDLWDLATRELAICKGVSEWRRLRHYNQRDLLLSQRSHDEEPRIIRVAAAQLRRLAAIVESLAADLLDLAPQASWSDYARAWKELLKKYLAIFADDDSSIGPDQALEEKILAILEQLAGLDAVHEQVSSSDFSQTFQHWLERSTVAPDPQEADGVTLLHAAAARGLCFRSLFILGMNEGVFPRTIREDAFLRDRDREVLERDLGYKINPKLAAFDEEKLLFTLLVNAARERLYCSFQRSDDGGRVLAPSWYLSELKRVLGGQDKAALTETTIPRSIVDKMATAPFHRDDLLLPEELAIRLSLDGKDPLALIEAFALGPALYQNGRKAVALLDQSADRLHGFDGAVGPLPGAWEHFSRRGLAPTALESYARCPFQFFARHMLGLERLDRPEDILGPSPAEFGELGHAILSGLYASLIDQGYFAGQASAVDPQALSAEIARRLFAEYEATHPVGYALTWESLKEQLIQLIRQVVALDLQELASSGFIPVSLETAVNDQLAGDWPEPLAGLAIHGRMDRIDQNRQENRLRVVDYKFKLGAQPSVADKNLYRAALRGERLQPPFYLLLGRRWAGGAAAQTTAEVEARFYYIAPRWSDGPLATATFGAEGFAGKLGGEIKNTLAYLAGGIREGRFFIQRSEACGHCEVAEICRKNHPPSLWRAENDPLTKPHRELSGKDPKKL